MLTIYIALVATAILAINIYRVVKPVSFSWEPLTKKWELDDDTTLRRPAITRELHQRTHGPHTDRIQQEKLVDAAIQTMPRRNASPQ